MPDAKISRGSWHAVFAGYLGWTLDAFDFFVVIFMYDTLAAHFGVSKVQLLTATSFTLAFRPVGALLFGLLADRFGRRAPLMANVIFFSVVEFACGFAPNFTVFFLLRCLYGIGMGGEWGVGSSLAMELAPRRWRGLLSGILQSGYSMGYLLAAVAARVVLPIPKADLPFGTESWQWMFWIGGLPALLALYIRMSVPESEAWKQHRAADLSEIFHTVRRHAGLVLYLVLMLTFFMFLSHGTQDLYPDFLRNEHGVSQQSTADLAILYNVGAILGAVIFGQLSERIGRRYAIVAALGLCLLLIPAWAFGSTVTMLAAASFVMQMGVQGAWGIIPAHLNEMAPDSVRGLVPGLAYQLGILFASPTSNIEHTLKEMFGYKWALAGFEGFVVLALATVVLFGREQKGKDFVRDSMPVASA